MKIDLRVKSSCPSQCWYWYIEVMTLRGERKYVQSNISQDVFSHHKHNSRLIVITNRTAYLRDAAGIFTLHMSKACRENSRTKRKRRDSSAHSEIDMSHSVLITSTVYRQSVRPMLIKDCYSLRTVCDRYNDIFR